MKLRYESGRGMEDSDPDLKNPSEGAMHTSLEIEGFMQYAGWALQVATETESVITC